MPDLTPYRKLVTALVGAAVLICVQLGWDDANDVIVTLVPLLTALGVYAVPNRTAD